MRTCTKCHTTKDDTEFYGYHSWCKCCIREKKREYYLNNREQKLLEHARARARKFDMPFNITVEDVVIPEYCPYLNIKITDNNGKGRTGTNPSLDRINNSLGYVKGNVQVISDKANTMKNSATLDELLTFAKAMIARHDRM